MSKQQVLTMDGVALDALSNARFRVQLDNGYEVTAVISGKMRQKYIKVLPGDRVSYCNFILIKQYKKVE